MSPHDKARELVSQFGERYALTVANMIFNEHYRYDNPNAIYRGNFNEQHTNKEMCHYWNSVREFIEKDIIKTPTI